MKKNLFAIFAMVALFAIAPSCSSDDDGGSTYAESSFIRTTDLITFEVSIEGVISDEDILLSADTTYVVTNPLIVAEGATLTIEPGTTVKFGEGFLKYLLVLKGGKIYAEGTEELPITFGSYSGSRKWGGVIINGNAPIAGTKATGNSAETKIAPEYLYGGTDEADTSGVFTYVIIQNTGSTQTTIVTDESDSDIILDTLYYEHHALTLNGVGSGTVVNNIYVSSTLGDGLEIAGGCVDVQNLLVVNPGDDMLGITQGYTGTVSNVFGVWGANNTFTRDTPRGVEIEGNLDGDYPDYYNQTDCTVENVSMIIKRTAEKNTNIDNIFDLVEVSRNAKAYVSNVYVNGSLQQFDVTDLIDVYDNKGVAVAGSYFQVFNAGLFVTNTINAEDQEEFEVYIEEIEEETTKSSDILGDYTFDLETICLGCYTTIFAWTEYTSFY